MEDLKYKELLIRTVKAENYPSKNELIPLIQNSSFSFDYTSTYNRKKWNQCEVYLTIRIAPERKKKLESHYDYLKQLCFEVYEDIDEFDLE